MLVPHMTPSWWLNHLLGSSKAECLGDNGAVPDGFTVLLHKSYNKTSLCCFSRLDRSLPLPPCPSHTLHACVMRVCTCEETHSYGVFSDQHNVPYFRCMSRLVAHT
jgi:hypothetical protein